MARKKDKHGKGKKSPSPAVELARRVRTHWERGDYFHALQAAEKAVEVEPNDDRLQMLAEAQYRHADRLAAQGGPESAKSFVLAVLESKATSPLIRAAATRLALKLGLTNIALTENEADSLTMLATVFDHCVFHDDVTALPEEHKQDLLAVRQAFAAWDTGDEEGTWKALAGIPRRSLAADWRIFLRGLSHRVAGRTDEGNGFWDRLAPIRMPSRLARAFRTLDSDHDFRVAFEIDQLDHESDFALIPNERVRVPQVGENSPIADFASEVFAGEPIVPMIDQLQFSVAERNFGDLPQQLARLQKALLDVIPDVHDVMSDILYGALLSSCIKWISEENSPNDYEPILAVLERPAIDPTGDRFRALACDFGHGSLQESRDHWLSYLETVSDLNILTEPEKKLAAGLIHARLGKFFLAQAKSIANSANPREWNEDTKLLFHRAEEFLKHAVEEVPSLHEAHRELIDCLNLSQKSDESAKLIRLSCERFPGDTELLLLAGVHPQIRQQPLESLAYLEKLLQLKPLDPKLQTNVVSAKTHAIQWHVARREFDQARALQASLEGAQHNIANSLFIRGSRAMIEHAAGDESFLDRYLAAMPHPMPARSVELLALLIHSRLMNVETEKTKKIFLDWQASIQHAPDEISAEQAICMLSIAGMTVGESRKWRIEMFERLSRWFEHFRTHPATADRLQTMIELLRQIPGKQNLCLQLEDRAYRSYPSNPLFQYQQAKRELQKGPLLCDRVKVRHLLDGARKTLEAQGPHADVQLLNAVRVDWSVITEVSEVLAELGCSPDELRSAIEKLAIKKGLDLYRAQQELARLLNSEDDVDILSELFADSLEEEPQLQSAPVVIASSSRKLPSLKRSAIKRKPRA